VKGSPDHQRGVHPAPLPSSFHIVMVIGAVKTPSEAVRVHFAIPPESPRANPYDRWSRECTATFIGAVMRITERRA